MLRVINFLSLLLILVFIPISANSQTITVIGEGQTRQAAINEGIRAGIEEALGAESG